MLRCKLKTFHQLFSHIVQPRDVICELRGVFYSLTWALLKVLVLLTIYCWLLRQRFKFHDATHFYT